MPIIIENRKAKFEYKVVEKFQAGLSLSGLMVKALRGKKTSILGWYIINQKNQLQIIGAQVGEIQENLSLLLNKKEKAKIIGYLSKAGYTAIVLNIKTEGRWLKADIAVVQGKNKRDKRLNIKKRDLDRESMRGLQM